MSIIVNNAFSTKMLPVGGLVEFTEITEEQFRAAISAADEIVIGHQDTADYFGVELNRQTIHLNEGDLLFVCEANSKTGGRLPSGTEFLSQMGEDFFFRFLKVEVL